MQPQAALERHEADKIALRPKDSADLVQRVSYGIDMLENVDCDDYVEAFITERKRFLVPKFVKFKIRLIMQRADVHAIKSGIRQKPPEKVQVLALSAAVVEHREARAYGKASHDPESLEPDEIVAARISVVTI